MVASATSWAIFEMATLIIPALWGRHGRVTSGVTHGLVWFDEGLFTGHLARWCCIEDQTRSESAYPPALCRILSAESSGAASIGENIL